MFIVGAGFVAMIRAIVKYPPLWLHWLDPYLLLILLLAPGALIFALEVSDQLELKRSAVLVGLVFVVGSAVLPARAAFIFLNGALDRNPPIKIQTSIYDAHVNDGDRGPYYVLGANVPWNQTQIYEDFIVTRDTFFFSHTGDSFRLAIYPGAFSTPWAGNAVLSNGQREFRFKFRPRM